MVDEERLADALSAHIDARLAGQPLPLEDSPEELKQLLDVADRLATIDLPPRPAFDQQIRQALSDRHGGGNGGPPHFGNMPLLLVLGLVALIGIAGVIALTVTLVIGVLPPHRDRLPTSTPRAPATIIAPTPVVTVTPSLPSPTLAPEPTATRGDTIQPLPASTRDTLKATPPTLRSNLGGQTDGHAGADSGGDSDHHGGDGDDEHDDEDDD